VVLLSVLALAGNGSLDQRKILLKCSGRELTGHFDSDDEGVSLGLLFDHTESHRHELGYRFDGVFIC